MVLRSRVGRRCVLASLLRVNMGQFCSTKDAFRDFPHHVGRVVVARTNASPHRRRASHRRWSSSGDGSRLRTPPAETIDFGRWVPGCICLSPLCSACTTITTACLFSTLGKMGERDTWSGRTHKAFFRRAHRLRAVRLVVHPPAHIINLNPFARASGESSAPASCRRSRRSRALSANEGSFTKRACRHANASASRAPIRALGPTRGFGGQSSFRVTPGQPLAGLFRDHVRCSVPNRNMEGYSGPSLQPASTDLSRPFGVVAIHGY